VYDGGACISLKRNSCFKLPVPGLGVIVVFSYISSPSAMPVDICDTGRLFSEYALCWKLDGAVRVGAITKGLTRSIERAPYEELKGLLRGGSGRVEGVYGNDMASVEEGECDNEGAVLMAASDALERLYRGRGVPLDGSDDSVSWWNWRR
jgi:hypothetical protein